MVKSMRAAAAACCVAVFVAGAGAPRWAGAQGRPPIIITEDMSSVISYDPDRAWELPAATVIANTYDTLVAYEGGGSQPVGRLAQSWTVSPDGTDYVFELRHGVRFTSGNELTSADVIWSFNRLKNLKDNPSYMLDPIAQMEAKGPYAVEIKLRRPDISFLSRLTAFQSSVLDNKTLMMHGGTDGPDAAKQDTATPWINSHSAGTGPWILTSFTPYQQTVLAPNPHYWGGPVYGGQIILVHATEAGARLLAFRSQRAQIALGLPLNDAHQLRSIPRVHMLEGDSYVPIQLGMNTKGEVSEPLSNPLVRSAIKYAVDVDGIVDNLLQGESDKPATVIPVGFLGSDQAFNDRIRLHRNMAKARALLAQAGYPNGFSTTLTYPTATVDYGVSYDVLAPKVASDLGEVGIKVTLDPTTRPKTQAAYRAGTVQLVMQLVAWDYLGVGEPAELLAPGGSIARRLGYQNAGLRQIVEDALAAPTQGRFVELFHQFLASFVDSSPWVALGQPKVLIPVWDNVQGVRFAAAIPLDLRQAAMK
jgi:peptide/nickel transport system substrate-binding protein